MTGLVARAEKRGLVQRAANPKDGRAVDVFLTDAGRAFADEVSARTADALASLTGEPAPLERRRLQALLERVLARPTGSD